MRRVNLVGKLCPLLEVDGTKKSEVELESYDVDEPGRRWIMR